MAHKGGGSERLCFNLEQLLVEAVLSLAFSNFFFLLYRYNNHPMLNDRYLLLMLLGKGGFSEVHKVSFKQCVNKLTKIYILINNYLFLGF